MDLYVALFKRMIDSNLFPLLFGRFKRLGEKLKFFSLVGFLVGKAFFMYKAGWKTFLTIYSNYIE